MLEHMEWVADVDREEARPPHLPDLTAVDLRTLRFMEDPELVAAVERLLWQPGELADAWPEGALTEDDGNRVAH
ncbi:hypothetical protein [Streptomyces roseicoloratus]|uniref:FXSXX-COOH protein n=1 Tax=Streptomyces roseicoloratus TaxID=2508722 RepID=A0ABY9RSF3_9ACTN|nr:hypothetical protein [Streptomyces roseicoloratus]WMX45101.1 hypothetical protein RGF97_09865 [Streptomyces roseicoloratus]